MKFFRYFPVVLLSLILFLYIVIDKKISVDISPSITILNESLSNLSSNNISNLNPNDFKKISIDINVSASKFLYKDIIFEYDDLYDIISDTSVLKKISDSSFYFPNDLKLETSIIVFAPKVDNKYILDSIKDFKLLLMWTDIYNNKHTKVYYLKDFIN